VSGPNGSFTAVRRPTSTFVGNPRWFISIAILGLVALGLSGVTQQPPSVGSTLPAEDEILAYHVGEDRDLVIKIPIEIDAVETTTWAAIPREHLEERAPDAGGGLADPSGLRGLSPQTAQTQTMTRCDSALRYPYGIQAVFVNERGKEVAKHDYDLESRVSCDPEHPGIDGEYAARLAAGGGPVTDPRTVLIATRDALPRGGLLRLRAKPAPAPDAGADVPPRLAVLTRLEGRYKRGEALRAVFERSLDADERRRITGNVSALGFADLPADARLRVLTTWARRLEAAGVEGQDYHTSRLLLRRFRTPYPRSEGRGASEFVIGERHAAALNFRGPVDLHVEGPPGRKVRVADGYIDPATGARPEALGPALLDLGPQGRASIPLRRGDIRTVVIDAVGPDFGVRFSVPRDEATAQIGEILHHPTPEGLRIETPPDVRIVRYLDLDPKDPVLTRIAPGQELLGILMRTEVDVGGGVDHAEATVVARWGKGEKDAAHLQVELPRSRFEWWSEGLDATDPRMAILRVPPGVEQIEITGDPRTRIRLRTLEPGVTETLYRIPYRVELQEDETWRYAPFDVSTWTDIRATNLDDLERKDRFSDLREQVRIERTGKGARGPGDVPERTLLPEHAPVHRRLLSPAYQSAGEGYPGDAWTPVILPKDVIIASEGARAERLMVIWRAERGRLGKSLKLEIDGEEVSEERIATLSGTLRVDVPPGRHRVEVKGLGDTGAAYVDAAPADGGAIVRRRDVYELTGTRPMEIRFPQHPGETLHLVLFVVTQGGNEPFRLKYSIGGARPASRIGAFFGRVTIPQGELTGRTGEAGKGTLWEAATDRRGTDGIARTVIRLGDDLDPGERIVRIWLQGQEEEGMARRVWIGAVLVGQAPEGRVSDPRVWVEDD